MKVTENKTEKMQKSILKGPIVRTLLVLGWPLMLTNAFQMLYSVVDMFWLGRYVGTEGIAATSLSWPLVFFLVSLAGGLSIAGTALVSQYVGMKNFREVRKSAGQVFMLLAIASVILSFIGILITDPILGFMGAPEEVITLSSPYIKIIFTSMPFMFMIMTFASILRGWGDTWTPMIISAISVVINVVLDPFLIAGFGPFPAMGVTGAAIATFTARAVAAAACTYLLFYGKHNLRIKLRHMKLEMVKVKQIFKIGIPASLGQSLVALGFIVMLTFVSSFGTEMLATYGIGTRLVNIVFIITGGITGAAVTMIGQNLGANNIGRASRILRTAILLTVGLLLVCSSIFYLFSPQFFGFFTTDRTVIAASREFMLAFGFSIMGFGIFSSIQAAYQASGRTVPSMIMGMIRLWGMRVPFSYIFAFLLGWGAAGIWVGMGLSNYLSAILALVWALTGSWKSSVIKDGKKSISLPRSQNL
ncbi:MAG: MATE family efflux transporter [Thermoplasmata archaeon]|nr:MATE family efflux transporter [Thermoplasmata archaeon]